MSNARKAIKSEKKRMSRMEKSQGKEVEGGIEMV